jgi:hypothetical protein
MLAGLLKFWPVLIPFLLYFGWLAFARARAKKLGLPLTRFTDGPWVMTLIASLIVAVLCFIVWGLSFEATSGDYIPPHVENGNIVPGGIYAP